MDGMLRNGRWYWALGAAVLLMLIAGIWIAAAFMRGSDVTFEHADGLLIIGNSHYEAAFYDDHGGVAYLQDKQASGKLSVGNRGGNLWWAFMDDNSSFNSSQADSFSYEWDAGKGRLLLHYGGKLQVDVTAAFSADSRIALSAVVKNKTAGTIRSFRLPYELKVASDQVKDGLLPMLPGVKLRAEFFRENNSYDGQYPGVMFAPYVALRTNNGNLAVYDVSEHEAATMSLGFKNQVDDAGVTGIVHDYKTFIKPDAEWRSPRIMLQIGKDYPDSIESFRTLAGISAYPSLDEKLGDDERTVFQLPFYKMDISALKDADWQALRTDYADRLNYSGILHLVGFQQGGHDENYPDFIPPDPKWGSPEDFREFVRDAHAQGHRVVPYTNFSWWGVHSPTLNSLPSGIRLEDIVVQQENGTLIKEDYGPHSGYVMNPNHPFVLERIAEEHRKLFAEAGFDGVFEDQWGIRDVPFLYNESASDDPSTAYFQGVRDYFASVQAHLYTEDGIDVLGQDALGFMGTNLLWDRLGYRPKTAAYSDYYPMIGMLERDKVMLFQHDLAAETMTDDQEMLRWNLAMGYNLSGDLYNGANNPWLDVIGVFQRYVLANYVDERVKSFTSVSPAVTKTEFDTYAVIANWDDRNPYPLDSLVTLAPGGFDVVSDDSLVRAGSYTRFNGFDLDPGEHDLVIVRGDKDIRVFQPFGADTTLSIRKGADWAHVHAAAYTADGTKIADLPVTEDGENVTFDYIGTIFDQRVAYVQLSAAATLSEVTDVPFHKAAAKINLALEQPVESTTDTAKEFPAKQAVDGDPYTYWESMPKRFPQSLTLDLGQVREVDELVLKLPPLDAWEARDQKIEVLGSEDGQSFAVLLPSQAYTFDPKAANTVSIPLDGAKTRYLRLTIADNTGWPAAQISELEVYGQ
ncbi:MAG TPA: discoidin domain-containing protein [Bacilli bacterium]